LLFSTALSLSTGIAEAGVTATLAKAKAPNNSVFIAILLCSSYNSRSEDKFLLIGPRALAQLTMPPLFHGNGRVVFAVFFSLSVP
jgi:hypothetical protein